MKANHQIHNEGLGNKVDGFSQRNESQELNEDSGYDYRAKLKEWNYQCTDELREEAHTALKREYEAAAEEADVRKFVLENGIFIQYLGGFYLYQFEVSQLTLQSIQSDKPHRLEIRRKFVDGKIDHVGKGKVTVRLVSNHGKTLSRLSVVFDVSILLDLVDRRLVEIDRFPSDWQVATSNSLFTDLELTNCAPLPLRCDHEKRADNKHFDKDQLNAVAKANQMNFCLIWGPPGTGKTHTLLGVIAEHLANGKHILFASNTNSAIDNLFESMLGNKCPYEILSSLKEAGKLLRIGTKMKDEVKKEFSPSAIAAVKAEIISGEINEKRARIKEIEGEVSTVRDSLITWENAQFTVQEWTKLTSQLDNTPSKEILEQKIRDERAFLKQYQETTQILVPLLKQPMEEVLRIFTDLSASQERTPFASKLVVRKETTLAKLRQDIDKLRSKTDSIESSFLRKHTSKLKLETIKNDLVTQEERASQLEAEIDSAQITLRKCTEHEMGCLSKLQSGLLQINTHASAVNDLMSLNEQIDWSKLPQHSEKRFTEMLERGKDIFTSLFKPDSFDVIVRIAKTIDMHSCSAIDSYYDSVRKSISQTEEQIRIQRFSSARLDEISTGYSSSITFIKQNRENLPMWQAENEKANIRIAQLSSEIGELGRKLEKIEQEIIQQAQLLGMTMVKASYDRQFADFRFDVLIVDEFSMISLPQLYCVASLIKEKVILCGDHLQLPPIGLSKAETAKKWMIQSFYDWHEGSWEKRRERQSRGPSKLEPFIARLQEQRRMPPEVSRLIKSWYEEASLSLVDNWENKEEALGNATSHELLKNRVTILDTSGTNCYSSKSQTRSRYNLIHSGIVAQVCKEFLVEHGIKNDQIFCLSPYRYQANLTRAVLKQVCPTIAKDLEGTTSTIHQSQGQGAPIVIYDLTDGAEQGLSGFHKNREPNLLNVAISRTETRLILVCHLEKMVRSLGPLLDNPLKGVFCSLARAKTPVIDAMTYFKKVFKKVNLSELLVGDQVQLSELQKDSILPLNAENFYIALSDDLRKAEESVLIVSPFITRHRMDNIKPLLLDLIRRTDSRIKIEIITRPPERMFNRYKKDDVRGASARAILNSLVSYGIKVSLNRNAHEKLIVIDERISYWGSLNPLSWGDTDEINTRLEAEGLAQKFLQIAVSGKSYPYVSSHEPLRDDAIKDGLQEVARKELNELAWAICGLYHRPRMALLYGDTVERLVLDPPASWEEYLEIPEFRKRNCILLNHMEQIENIIYPIRGSRLPALPKDFVYHKSGQTHLFDDESGLVKGPKLLRKQKPSRDTLDKYIDWDSHKGINARDAQISHLKKGIRVVLEQKRGKTCKKDILHSQVFRQLHIKTSGKPKKELMKRFNQALGEMLNKEAVKQFKATRYLRIKLVK